MHTSKKRRAPGARWWFDQGRTAVPPVLPASPVQKPVEKVNLTGLEAKPPEVEPPDDSDRQNRGFTLIELLAVIAIIAILAWIIFPGIKESSKKANRSPRIGTSWANPGKAAE